MRGRRAGSWPVRPHAVPVAADAFEGLLEVGLLPPRRRPDAELLAWSSVHGLAMLLIDGPLQHLDDTHAQQICSQLLDHVDAGLLSPAP